MHRSDPRVTHAQAVVAGRVDRFMSHSLISSYADHSYHSFSPYPLRLFRRIPNPNVVSWTALLAAHSGTFLALRHFAAMLRRQTLPNARTIASLLRTTTSLPALRFGLSAHALSLKLALSSDPFAGSALVSFYAKCGLPWDARKVFDGITEKDEVCFAAVVVGLAQNSCPASAVEAFGEMVRGGVRSTATSVSGALCGAAQLASLEQCLMMHCHAVVAGLGGNAVVGSALVDGYGKAGLIAEARKVFDENLAVMNSVGYNAMMAGYALQGDKDSTVELFGAMERRGFVPDKYSFTAVLTAFCNVCMDIEAECWFSRMTLEFGLEPGLEHYTCLIGTLCRAGRLTDAEKVALTMPFSPDAALWRVMLSACALHGEPDMALRMAKRLLELDPHDDSAYVIVSNALSGAGRWEEVAEVRKAMRERAVRKEIGRSWIEVRGKSHVFLAGDRRHEMRDEIYAKLGELLEEIEKLGYVPIWGEMLQEVGKDEKKRVLWSHSEKLALAFGVLTAGPGKAVRIVKNLRICRDCHEAFKFMSRVLEREIILRDAHRYHRFSNGECTCQGVW